MGKLLLRPRAWSLLATAGLAVIALAQVWIVATGSVGNLAGRAWGGRGESSLERSARVAFGDEFAEFISFIRRTVPESSKLVVPSKAVEPVYGDVGLMQYFLRPRRIIDCPAGDDTAPCIRSMTGMTTYLLALPGFPPQAEAGLYRDLVEFEAQEGVYVPRDPGGSRPESVGYDPAASSLPSAVSWCLDLLALAGIIGIGFLIARAIVPDADSLSLAATSLPLGLASLTWVVFLLAWVGIPLTLWSFVVSGFALVVLASLASAIAVRNPRHPTRGEVIVARQGIFGRGSPTPWAFGGPVVVAALVISVARSYSGWDDMAAYAVQGYGMAREGSLLASLAWGPSAAGYPLNVQLAISMFHMLDGDVLPGSKLLFPFFLGAIMLAGYRAWRRAGHRDGIAACLMLILGTIPLVLEQSTTGYTNLPFASYLLLGVLFVLEGALKGSGRLQLLGSLFLGAAVWTRPEGWVLASCLLAAFLLAAKRNPGFILRPVPLLLPVTCITLLWMGFGLTLPVSGQPAQAFRVTLASLSAGDLRLDAIYWPVRYLAGSIVDPPTWGLLAVVSVALLFGIRRRPSLQHSEALMLTASAALAAITVLALFYVVSSNMDLRAWLGTSVDRMFLPAVVMGWIGLGGLTVGHPIARG